MYRIVSEKFSFKECMAYIDDAFFELIRMLMSKNVNNDVNKDLPIFTKGKKCSFSKADNRRMS